MNKDIFVFAFISILLLSYKTSLTFFMIIFQPIFTDFESIAIVSFLPSIALSRMPRATVQARAKCAEHVIQNQFYALVVH